MKKLITNKKLFLVQIIVGMVIIISMLIGILYLLNKNENNYKTNIYSIGGIVMNKNCLNESKYYIDIELQDGINEIYSFKVSNEIFEKYKKEQDVVVQVEDIYTKDILVSRKVLFENITCEKTY